MSTPKSIKSEPLKSLMGCCAKVKTENLTLFLYFSLSFFRLSIFLPNIFCLCIFNPDFIISVFKMMSFQTYFQQQSTCSKEICMYKSNIICECVCACRYTGAHTRTCTCTSEQFHSCCIEGEVGKLMTALPPTVHSPGGYFFDIPRITIVQLKNALKS